MKPVYHLVLLTSLLLTGCAADAGRLPTKAASTPTAAPVQPTDSPTPTPIVAVSQWEEISKLKLPTSARMAVFIDPNFGLFGGPDRPGKAQTTQDGGKTWTKFDNSSGCLFGLEVIDTQTMWECNASDVRVTTDGGQTWADSPRGAGQPGCKMSAVDAQTAWVISPKQFIVTHDGGVTRAELTLPGNLKPKQVAAISFRSLTNGYILDGAGKLYVTADGGQTWNTMPAPDFGQYGEMEVTAEHGQPYAALRFFDADHGLMIVSLGGGGASKVVALRTRDGGQTWEEQTIPAPFGTPYLSRDGKYLTMVSVFAAENATIFRYTGD